MAPSVGEERMGEGPGPAQDRTALWEALLHDVDEGGQPLATRRTIRLMAWLRRGCPAFRGSSVAARR
jgi:hypothetical protein